MTLGKKIKLLRTIHSLSLAKLAFQLNISKGYLSELENDIRKNPSMDILIKLSKFYEISLDDLIDVTKKMTLTIEEIEKEMK